MASLFHLVRCMHPQASFLLFRGEDTDYASHAKLLPSVSPPQIQRLLF